MYNISYMPLPFITTSCVRSELRHMPCSTVGLTVESAGSRQAFGGPADLPGQNWLHTVNRNIRSKIVKKKC